jgi:hypothetical protein
MLYLLNLCIIPMIFYILHLRHIFRISHISHVWRDRPFPLLPPSHLANPLADRIRINDADSDRTISRRFKKRKR